MTGSSLARGVGWAETSAAQDGLWFLSGLDPGSPGHRVCRAYRVVGDLDGGALRAAWQAVVRRHDALRTTLVERGGLPMQRIAAGHDAPPSFTDFGPLPAADPEAAVSRWVARQAAIPMRLAEGPLARLSVARIGDREHVVVLLLHRAIADEASMSILVNELSACYAAELHGTRAHRALPDLPAQYSDYARWQRGQASGPGFRKMLDWWTSALTPLPPALTLPVDRPRPAEPSSAGGIVRFDWGDEMGRLLLRLCETERTTPFVALLAGLQALLFRYGGEERVAVGAAVPVRPQSGFENLIGPFENLIVVCADFSGRPTFRELLGRVARFTGNALAHRELPFQHLVSALDVDRDPRRLPLSDVMYAFQETPEAELRVPGADVRPERIDDGRARTDLTLKVDRIRPSVAGFLEYRRALFDEASVRRILDQQRTLLAAALAEPDTAVDALPLDGPGRLRAAVRDADRITAAPPGEPPVHELVHMRAKERPTADAVAWDGDTITYRELQERAARVSDALGGLGGVEGAAVAVRMPAGPRQVAALLGILDAGAHMVCLGSGDAGERGRAVLSGLRPACLVVDGETPGDDLCEWYRRELGGRVLDVATLDHVRGAPRTPVRTAPGDRAYIAYTSGSTGRPKGIAQSHASFAQFVTWLAGEFGIGPGSRVAQWAASGYDAGLVEIFAALVAGATLCPVPERIRAHPEKTVQWLEAERVTLFQTVPSFARELLEVINTREGAGRPLPALDHLLLAGEALPGDLANGLRAALPSVRLVNLYGPTEAILATWYEVTGTVHGTTPIGTSIPGRQVLLLDERDRPCPAGVVGNIVIRSPYISHGYVGGRAADDAAFAPLRGPRELGIEGDCYRTGDLGRRRWDGLLEFRGRRDFQIKFYGTRMELTEIESALAAHPSVAECAVVPITRPDGLVARLVAYVVPRSSPEGATGDPAVWRAALRRRFGKAMPPVSFREMTDLPRNIGGKVDRGRLPAGRSAAPSARPPETAVEKGMAEIWSDLLAGEPGAERPSSPSVLREPDRPERNGFRADDTFFEAGGHSLLVLRLLDRIRERFGVELSLRDYFDNSSLADLARLVALRSAGAGAATTTIG
ncbi:non-ribosomal peptide synthetase [Thermomonospora cellulosilytica]|uniref:Amino acid adenylation domain-containing protein n=1 Tax=Thermomonospora cellulosilytica TaxID=1411118 RepID=A0A7W3N5A4_9ACTN|nr:AMP-binding protein [Thermomonospora cellulosilytica]MBA9007765.1 amino acid adenylation domain-containing protein [Thermomonospora cellulosilytica]